MIGIKGACGAILSAVFVCIATTARSETDVNKRLEQAEREIKQLQSRMNGVRVAVKESRTRITDASDRLKINGFLTSGVAINDGDDIEDPFIELGSEYSTSSISKLGIQTSFKINDRWGAVAQLVSRGTQDYNVSAEWAFLSYSPADNIQFKFGRQRAPFYLLSEYIDVGYALPWVIAPLEMYNLTTSTVDGASVIYDARIGASRWTWQLYGGASQGQEEAADASYKSNDAWGSNFQFEYSDWTFRLGYNAAHLAPKLNEGGLGDQFNDAITAAFDSVGPLLGVETNLTYDSNDLNWDAQYLSTGFSYDNGALVIMGELSNLRLVDSYRQAGDAGYIMIGYRFGRWMPHVTFAKYQTDSNSDNEVRALQKFLSDTANAAYTSMPPGTPGLVASNAAINSQLATQNGLPGGSIPSNYVIPSTVCTTLSCSGSLLATMGLRDNLLTAAQLYGETLYNTMEQRVQEQQSYSLGLVFDVMTGVRAKVQATHYEQFGSSDYQYFSPGTASFGGREVAVLNGFTTTRQDGIGRFTGSPGAAGGHTAIYSLSIDAVF